MTSSDCLVWHQKFEQQVNLRTKFIQPESGVPIYLMGIGANFGLRDSGLLIKWVFNRRYPEFGIEISWNLNGKI